MGNKEIIFETPLVHSPFQLENIDPPINFHTVHEGGIFNTYIRVKPCSSCLMSFTSSLRRWQIIPFGNKTRKTCPPANRPTDRTT